MTRLPQPGSDDGVWGGLLNDYLAVSHTSDGSIKDAIVTEAKLDSTVQAKLNASGVDSVNGRTGAIVLIQNDVGLGNVDNTTDLAKPISTATQTALNAKADASSVSAKVLLINDAGSLPAGTPAGIVVVVKA